MDNKKLISVIMPAYNSGKFIAQSIGSVIGQTYPYWELIVIDDGSTDETKNNILKFTEKDHRIKYLYQANGKQGRARNTGIKNAKGNLIAFLDADDTWLPEKLEKQVQLMDASNADLVFSNVIVIDDENRKIKDGWGVEASVYKGASGLVSFLQSNKIPALSVLAKKEVINAAGGFKEFDHTQYGEDYDLWMRLLMQGACFVSTAETLGAYRNHSSQSTNNKKAMLQVLQSIYNVKATSAELLKEKNNAIRMWKYRYLTADKNPGKQELLRVISFHRSGLTRIFLRAIYLVTGAKLFRTIFQKLSAAEIKLQKNIG